ncbi:DUF4422 domain-containing protein [Dickeya oryzae]
MSAEFNVKEHYEYFHRKDDLDLVRDIIEKYYGDYLECFDLIMSARYISICNMFIARREILVDYSEWLFDILFKLNDKVDITEYDSYQKRVFGFLAERLFNVWIEKNKNKLNIEYRNTIQIMSIKERIQNIARIMRSFLLIYRKTDS